MKLLQVYNKFPFVRNIEDTDYCLRDEIEGKYRDEDGNPRMINGTDICKTYINVESIDKIADHYLNYAIEPWICPYCEITTKNGKKYYLTDLWRIEGRIWQDL